MAIEAFMITGTIIIVAGWSIALLKMPPFAFIVSYLSNSGKGLFSNEHYQNWVEEQNG
jgi:hypothetical protein